MGNDDSFLALMDRLQAGDQSAAQQIFDEFSCRLVALARKRLSAPILKKEDPEDVLQSVFNSFFRRHAEGQFDLGCWQSLWQILVIITLRKCGHRLEYYQALRRNVYREVTPPASEAPHPLAGKSALLESQRLLKQRY
jgi:RNA polymerase sigma-70 factor (ECF subfamily)